MNGAPLVSIVVPVYNGAAHLDACLRSLTTQTYPHREILVLDDASTDETPAVVARYAGAVHAMRQPANVGQFANVTTGLRLATGSFLAVYHADDVYDPTIVEESVAFLQAHPAASAVFCLDRFLDEAGREYGRLVLPPEVRGRALLAYDEVLRRILELKNVFLPTPGAMMRADRYRQLEGFREQFGSAADLDLWLQLARTGPLGLLPKHLFGYRHRVTSVGQAYQRLRTEPENYFGVMESHLNEPAVRAAVPPSALRAFEAHRAVDGLRRAVNAYIGADVPRARQIWREVSVRHLFGSDRIARPRHLFLWALLGAAVRLPHVATLAAALHWRYYGRLAWWKAPAG